MAPQSALNRSKSAVPSTGGRDGRTKARDPPLGPASARPSSMHAAAASKDDSKVKAGHHQMRRSVSPNKKGTSLVVRYFENCTYYLFAYMTSYRRKEPKLSLWVECIVIIIIIADEGKQVVSQ